MDEAEYVDVQVVVPWRFVFGELKRNGLFMVHRLRILMTVLPEGLMVMLH